MDSDSVYNGEDDGLVSEDEMETFVDVTLSLGGMPLSDVPHIMGVLSRVCTGLAMEGFCGSLHTRPFKVAPYPSEFVSEEEDDHGG